MLIAQLRDIYDAYRSAQLTRRYYEACLVKAAQSAPKLAIGMTAGLLLLAWAFPQYAIAYVLVMFLLLWNENRMRPTVNPDIPRYAGLVTAFHAHGLALRDIVNKVHNTHDLPHELLAVYTASRRQMSEMNLELDAQPDRILLNECYEKVNREIGAKGLWVPRAPAAIEERASGLEGAIHQTRLGGQVAVTPRIGLEPPAPWPVPGGA